MVVLDVPKKGKINFDEEPSRFAKDKISKLRPVFPDKNKEGTITGANASKINDGACAILVASEEAVKNHKL